jgi:adenine C2-methylase RlmN of 23S rRNA A2503 and tRNA A37
MPPPRRLTRRSLLDVPALVAFLERGLGPGKRETAERHARAIVSSAVAAVRGGLDRVDLSPSAFPHLPAFAREGIPAEFDLFTTTVAEASTSADGSTTKIVVSLQDGHRVEAVVMRHDKGRNTLCVSSQVGCKMGCTFCATGTLGELGNLTGGEILEQLAHADRLLLVSDDPAPPNAAPAAPAARAGIRNVVFMGMGEPLNNYAAVLAALGPMTDPRGFALAPRHVTVSTVGVVPRIRTLAKDAPGVRLALSLHAPNQTLRERIVPTATAYPLPKLMEAVDAYLASGPKARAMIEYCVLGGVNDDVAHATELGELLRGRDVVVNLIPYNPTDVPMGHEPPTEEAVRAMAAILAGPPYAHRTTVRKEMGQDIAGACGQLALKKKHPDEHQRAAGDIEDLAGPGAGAGAGGGGGGGGRAGAGAGVGTRARSSATTDATAARGTVGVGAMAKLPGGGLRLRARAERLAAAAANPDADAAANPDAGANAIATGTSRRAVSAETMVRALNGVAITAFGVLLLASAWKFAILAGVVDEL